VVAGVYLYKVLPGALIWAAKAGSLVSYTISFNLRPGTKSGNDSGEHKNETWRP